MVDKQDKRTLMVEMAETGAGKDFGSKGITGTCGVGKTRRPTSQLENWLRQIPGKSSDISD